jgi:tripartite-type tricarboxylate transporter receptor subunit TctC
VLGLGVFGSPEARAADEFKGKTISIVVGYSAGGGYDLYARALARHMGKYVPGSPTVIVQNMPGAASLLAVRHLDSNAAKDGTVWAMFDPGLILTTLSSGDPNGVKLSDYRWIGTMLRDVRICYAWGPTGIKTYADLMARKEFLLGSTAKGSNAYVNSAILKNVLKAPVRLITGYPGSNEQRLALERGELEGNCASWSALPADWRTDPTKAVSLVRFSPARPPDMPESVPYVVDLAKSQQQKDLMQILLAPTELGRPFVVAKQVPDEPLRLLRAGFAATLKDLGFVAEAEKQQLPLDPLTGGEAEQIVAKIYAASPAVVAQVKEALD